MNQFFNSQLLVEGIVLSPIGNFVKYRPQYTYNLTVDLKKCTYHVLEIMLDTLYFIYLVLTIIL